MPEVNNVEILNVLSQAPLVIAFIYFSLKIINIYQTAQAESQQRCQAYQESEAKRNQEFQERQSKTVADMMLTVVTTWAEASDKRDQEMQKFISEMRDQDRAITKMLITEVNDLNKAIRSQEKAFTEMQAELIVAENIILPVAQQQAKEEREAKTKAQIAKAKTIKD